MMEGWAFICSCSECSLEGEAFLENERIRTEIHEKDQKTKELEKNIPGLFGAAQRGSLMELLETSQATLKLVKKLDIQLEIARLLRLCYEDARNAVFMAGSRDLDLPKALKKEAEEHARKHGDYQMYRYKEMLLRLGDWIE